MECDRAAAGHGGENMRGNGVFPGGMDRNREYYSPMAIETDGALAPTMNMDCSSIRRRRAASCWRPRRKGRAELLAELHRCRVKTHSCARRCRRRDRARL